MLKFKRNILSEEGTDQAAGCLQQRLVDLIDLALQLKQAHWCVVGDNFRAVHLQLDEIIAEVRNGSDEIAERIAALGVAPDGRARTVAETTKLSPISGGFDETTTIVTTVADRLHESVLGLRESIGKLGDIDPISEDLLISISESLEKHLWMVQSQEL